MAATATATAASTPAAPKILIVEDEKVVARDLQQTLADFGYDASALATSGEEALHQAQLRCPDLVLMDIRIRGPMDGIATAAELRARFGVPVVYLTAYADDATLDRAKRTEPLGYLLKPVQAAELKSTVELSLYRHDMDRRVRERERWLDTTLHSMREAVLCVDAGGRVMVMNSAAEALLEVAARDAVGRSVADVVHLRQPLAHGPIDAALAAVGGGNPATFTDRILGGGGRSDDRIIAGSAAPVVDDGRVLGTVLVLRDITVEKNHERQLELEHRLSSLGTLAGGVAHEINNPLVAVTANLAYVDERLRRLPNELNGSAPTGLGRAIDEACEAIADAEAAARRIARVVGDLKVFSRPTFEENGKCDVRACIDWALRTTAHSIRARAQVVTDLLDTPPVAGDEARLGQVLVDLLLNASQAILPGSAEQNQITVCTHREGDLVAIEIADTGSGIRPEDRDRIFEPFFTTKPIGVGAGLGLAVCHGIVASLGGRIEVDTEVGRGSRFRVLLPAVDAAKPAVVPPRRPRVLVIDDEALVLRVLRRTLEISYDVITVDSGEAALALVADDGPFDVILCDLTMPSIGGAELFRRLSALAPEQAGRVVFISGGPEQGANDFLKAGNHRWLEKPVPVDELRAVVSDTIVQRGLAR